MALNTRDPAAEQDLAGHQLPVPRGLALVLILALLFLLVLRQLFGSIRVEVGTR